MEGYDKLKSFNANPLNSIHLTFSSSLNHEILEEYLKFLKKSKNIEQLHDNLKLASKKLSILDSFTDCKVEVYPGVQANTAEVRFIMTEKDFSIYQFEADMDPTRVSCRYLLRGLMKKPSLSEFKLGIVPYLNDFDGSFSYMDRISLVKDLNHGFKVGKNVRMLDLSAHQTVYFGEVFLKTWNDKHALSAGYHLRSNRIATKTLSLDLIKNCILPTDKYFIAYNYHNPAFLNYPLSVKLRTEIAKSQTSFTKTHLSIAYKYNFFSDYFWVNKAKLGFLHTFNNKKPCINDAFRYHNVKGFKYLGARQHGRDSNPEVAVDNLGTQKKLYFETMALKNSFPLFTRLKLTPYVYGSSAYVLEKPSWRDNIRCAVGFGMKWQLPFGSLDFSYASRVWRQPGDIPAEFQVFFTRGD